MWRIILSISLEQKNIFLILNAHVANNFTEMLRVETNKIWVYALVMLFPLHIYQPSNIFIDFYAWSCVHFSTALFFHYIMLVFYS